MGRQWLYKHRFQFNLRNVSNSTVAGLFSKAFYYKKQLLSRRCTATICAWASSVAHQDWRTRRRTRSSRKAVPVSLIEHHHCVDVLTIKQATDARVQGQFCSSFHLHMDIYLCWAPSWWPQPPGPSAWSWAAWRWGWGRCRGWAETEPAEWGPLPGRANSHWRRCVCLQKMAKKTIGIQVSTLGSFYRAMS